jgi:hypothetical protein
VASRLLDGISRPKSLRLLEKDLRSILGSTGSVGIFFSRFDGALAGLLFLTGFVNKLLSADSRFFIFEPASLVAIGFGLTGEGIGSLEVSVSS